jgi:nucleotide-binding universal stress UspA family protein
MLDIWISKETDMSSKPVPPGAVVVGVDGSPSSDLALDWAVAECARRGLPLHIIHAFPDGYPMANIGMGSAIGSLRQNADRVRTEAVAHAHRASPELAITCGDPAPGPASALVVASETADTVVVGSSGRSAGGLLLRSISVQVASHARAPVVVVHDASAPVGSPVVVGVDGLALSKNAIGYAYAQASSRGVGLTVVHGWWLEYVEGTSASAIWSVDWQEFAEKEQALVAESLSGWREKYPDVEVRRHSVRGLPVEALARQSENACLVVVGTRGRTGLSELLLGSVSQGVMHAAHCPVAIVHGPKGSARDRDNMATTSAANLG